MDAADSFSRENGLNTNLKSEECYYPELLKSTARSPASRQRSGKKTQLTASHSRAVRRYTHLYPFL